MAGATSCLATNAFTLKLVKPCVSIFLVTLADFFLTNGTRPNPLPLTCHWGPGIEGEIQVSDIRWLTRFVDEAREEGASHPSIEGEAIDEWIRIVRDTSSENSQPLNIKGEVEDEGVMCACVGVHSMT